MRFDPLHYLKPSLIYLVPLVAVITLSTPAHAQIIPTPGFPYEVYKVSSDSSVHFCRITDTDLIYAESKNGSLKLFDRNYITKTETEVAPINALLAAHTPKSAADIRVSPNGVWAAWPASGTLRGGIWVSKLDGQAKRHIDTPVARIISWAPEPSTLICFSSEEAAYSRLGYYNLETGDLDSDFHIARHGGLAGIDDGHGRRFLVCFCPLINHRAWSVSLPPAFKTGSTRFGLGGACVFEMYELSNTAVAKTGYAIDMPPKCDMIQAIVSPHQKYIIWELGFQGTTELWLSEMNGMNIRRAVVMVDEKNAQYTDAEPPIADVMWLPNSANIGCRVGGNLYVVTLDIDKNQPQP